ncbi:MAG: EF-hand domain-containing protein [Pseudomonadota bacterium]
MMIKTLKKNRLAVAALATIVLATGGISSASARDRDNGQARFERIDVDGNGQVTLAEFQSRMLERFSEADANNDGLVTKAELEEVMDGRRAERRIRGLLGMFDINRDEQVSLDELNNRQQKMFALADLDDSGFVTEEEMPMQRFAGGRGFGRDRDRN